MLKLDISVVNTDDNLSLTDSMILLDDELINTDEFIFSIENMIDIYLKCIEIKSYTVNNSIDGINIFKSELESYGIWSDNIDELNINLENVIVDTAKKIWDFIKQLFAKIFNMIKMLFTNINKIKQQADEIYKNLVGKEIDYDKFNKTVVTAIPADTVNEFLKIEKDLNEYYGKLLNVLDDVSIKNDIKTMFDKYKSKILNMIGSKTEQSITDILKEAYSKMPNKWYMYLISSQDKDKLPSKFKILTSFEKRTIQELGYANVKVDDIKQIIDILIQKLSVYKAKSENFLSITKNITNVLMNVGLNDLVFNINIENPTDNKKNIQLKLSIFLTRMGKNYMKLSKLYRDLAYSELQVLKAFEKSVKE